MTKEEARLAKNQAIAKTIKATRAKRSMQICKSREIKIQSNKLNKLEAVAWAIAIGAIVLGAALVFATASSGGTAAPATVPAISAVAPAAVAVVGWSATSTAIAICFAAGGVAAGKAILNSVRNNYKITEKVEDKDGKVIRLALKRK